MDEKPKILVVDDEPDARFLTSEILKEKYDTKEAQNVSSAIEIVHSWMPDIVLSDIKMPGDDGIVLLKYMRGNYPDVPIILMTGHADKVVAISALREGAFDFIEKPFEDEELFASVSRSVELTRLEKKLEDARARSLEAEKMATIGLMAGGIAHEINSPLGTILLLSSSLENHEDNKVVKASYQIAKTVKRISKIVKSLQSFSRNGKKDPFLDTYLKDIIGGVLDLCSKKFIDTGVELIVDNESMKNVVVQCRESEIAQVIFNIINNARDAVENTSEKWVKLGCRQHGGEVEIVITDSGPGIPEEIKEKIFLPFFTTKQVGKGTGLGLSISVGIVESHKGKIDIDSSNSYTTFIIHLPISQIHNLNKVS